MKKLIFLILLLLIAIFASQRILISACDRPIYYRIDTVDTKFNLQKEKLIEHSKKAAGIWNKAYGKDLLVFDPEGDLSINLIYDERQRLNSQLITLEEQLGSEKNSLDPKIAQFEKDEIAFSLKLNELNMEIEGWNQKGGAPPDIYNQLIQRQKDLQVDADRLNGEAKNLNLTTQNFNAQVGNFNQKVDTFNTAIEQRPEEGIYLGGENKIEIYFYTTQNELIHTIAHEMGHARGLEHTPNSKSIMYSKTNLSLTPSKEDLDELTAVCAKKSLFDIAISKVKMERLKLMDRLGSSDLPSQDRNYFNLLARTRGAHPYLINKDWYIQFG